VKYFIKPQNLSKTAKKKRQQNMISDNEKSLRIFEISQKKIFFIPIKLISKLKVN
jgi:hypothetical protein